MAQKCTVKITDNTQGPFRAADCLLAAASNSVNGLSILSHNANEFARFCHGTYCAVTHDPATAGVNLYVGNSDLNIGGSPVNGRLLRKGEVREEWAAQGNTVHTTEIYINGDNNAIFDIELNVQ